MKERKRERETEGERERPDALIVIKNSSILFE